MESRDPLLALPEMGLCVQRAAGAVPWAAQLSRASAGKRNSPVTLIPPFNLVRTYIGNKEEFRVSQNHNSLKYLKQKNL